MAQAIHMFNGVPGTITAQDFLLASTFLTTHGAGINEHRDISFPWQFNRTSGGSCVFSAWANPCRATLSLCHACTKPKGADEGLAGTQMQSCCAKDPPSRSPFAHPGARLCGYVKRLGNMHPILPPGYNKRSVVPACTLTGGTEPCTVLHGEWHEYTKSCC